MALASSNIKEKPQKIIVANYNTLIVNGFVMIVCLALIQLCFFNSFVTYGSNN